MGHHLDNCNIYAVDFDGTLCESRFPDIGAPNTKLINWLIRKQNAGDKVILWTNRMGERLRDAVEWSRGHGLVFDAVNENIPEIMERYKEILNGEPPSPKITADVFIDDAACGEGLPFNRSSCKMDDCWNESCAKNRIRIDNLGFSPCLCNLLHQSCIDTIYDLAVTTEDRLRRIHGINDRSIDKIRAVMEEHGYRL